MAARESSRQEIAKRLRDKYRERNTPGVFVAQDVGMQAYDYLKDLESCLPDGDSLFTVLADLIDPTCEVSSVDTYCNELGQLDGWEFHLTCGHSVKRPYYEAPSYCPDCGARVVNR